MNNNFKSLHDYIEVFILQRMVIVSITVVFQFKNDEGKEMHHHKSWSLLQTYWILYSPPQIILHLIAFIPLSSLLVFLSPADKGQALSRI